MIVALVALGIGLALGGYVGWVPAEIRDGTIVVSLRGETDAANRPRSLDELIEAARAQALRVRPCKDGYDVIDQLSRGAAATVAVRVLDPARVRVSTIGVMAASAPLALTAALALVPLFGPLTVTVHGESYRVDGARDQHELGLELSRHQTERLRALLARRLDVGS